MSKTKICPNCQKEVDEKATKCPYCQSDLRSWVRQHPIALLLAMLLIVPAFMSGVLGNSTPEPTSTPAEQIANQKKHDFAALAKQNVETTLKAPSTAKFNTSPTVTVDEKDPNSFEIESWVDSQNGFGAMIRSYWSIKAHYVGGDSEEETGTGSNWKIDEFIFDGKKVS